MKLNLIQRFFLFWWSLWGDPRLNEYAKNIEKGMSQVAAYKQAVAFAPGEFNHREIKAGHIVLDNGVPSMVNSVAYDYCEVLDENNLPAKRQWKDIQPVKMEMKWLVHFGFECQATLWTIIDSNFWITRFDATGWHVMDTLNQCQGEHIEYVHQLQDVFKEQTGFQLAIT